jgi:hypothetical protein
MAESRHKYLYERLGDQPFQQLVNALLVLNFPGYLPLPVRQADGGRDGVQRDGRDLLIYQVKWSATAREKDPVGWLSRAVAAEDANIRRLVADGAKKYVLVTNVASTGKARTGTFDRLEARLDAHAAAYGIDMSPMWRETVDAFVDSAPDAVKWSYVDMLAGHDLVRYLLDEQAASGRDRGLKDLVRKAAAAQWHEDERVKFSQVDLDREKVADLFVDVTASHVRSSGRDSPGGSTGTAPVGGVAAHLLSSPIPFTLVRGAPGQGKSTLGQFVCQAHRAAFVPADLRDGRPAPAAAPRFPLRLDLGDYAAWLQGADAFSAVGDPAPRRSGRRPPSQSTIEGYLAEVLGRAGGAPVTAATVQDLLERVPALVVLDGLDEVGRKGTRRTVVEEIERFCGRARAYTVPPKIVVTTRPSAGELPEPSEDLFEVLSLNPLAPSQREEYLRKWCAVRDIRGAAGRELRAGFKQRSAEPYIAELAGNPMQLTILLELLHKHGAATPSQRTELYDAYMRLLLAREANKHPKSVRKHRQDLEEIMPFLGWYLQSRNEEHDLSGRMLAGELKAAMLHFQRTYGKPDTVADELFEAATDRLWALTSKEQGAYEFEVVSLREYFAAKFLYEYAGEDDRRFDPTVVLRELLRRPYWLNTARFYGGNATARDIYVLAAGIRDELADSPGPQARIASWTLLTDGVFRARPDQAASLVDALLTDAGTDVLLDALDRNEVVPIPAGALPDEPHPAWHRLTAAISADPDGPDSPARARALQDLLRLKGRFAAWWADRTADAVGTGSEHAWLRLGAAVEAAAGLQRDLPGVALDGAVAQDLLDSGIVPPTGGDLETALLRAVLDGQCSHTRSIRSLPAQIAVALAPSAFLTAPGTTDGQADRRRQDAVAALKRSGSPYARVAAQRRTRAGEKASTFPTARTAAALFDLAGPCWLASELAILAAAGPDLSGYARRPGAAAFGPGRHSLALLAQTREHRDDPAWWAEQARASTSDLATAEWALALWAVAPGPVVAALLEQWEDALEQLPAGRRRALQAAAVRIARSGCLADRPVHAAARGRRGEALLSVRADTGREPRKGPGSAAGRPAAPPRDLRPLAAVAKTGQWFKIDSEHAYR